MSLLSTRLGYQQHWLPVLFIAISFCFAAIYRMAHPKEASSMLHGDALGYYIYLPATFLYHSLEHVDQLPLNQDISEQILVRAHLLAKQQSAKGFTTNQYTIGVSLMEAPFFLCAHAYASISHQKTNGYSDLYANSVCISALFYACLGLLLLYRILLKIFPWHIAFISLNVVFWGTNLFWFTWMQPGMAHIPLFFLYAWLLHATIQAHTHPKWHHFLSIGISIGLIVLLRPSDVVCVCIPLFSYCHTQVSIKQKIQTLQQHWASVLLGALCGMFLLAPQLLYWKHLTGQYLFYSYGNQSFNWSNPHIISGLLGARNGWLAYNPVMIIAMLGIVFYKPIKALLPAICMLLPAYVYIIYSWHCYNYINGYGSRPMIHMYPILILPLAAFIYKIWMLRRSIKILATASICMLLAINLKFIWLKQNNMLDSENSNWAYNVHMLGKTKLDYNDLVLFDTGIPQPNPNSISKIATLQHISFNDSLSPHYSALQSKNGNFAYELGGNEYAEECVNASVNPIHLNQAKWLRCSGKFKTNGPSCSRYYFIVLSTDSTYWLSCNIENKLAHTKAQSMASGASNDDFTEVYFFAPIPESLTKEQTIKMHVWNLGGTQLLIDDLKLELYN